MEGAEPMAGELRAAMAQLMNSVRAMVARLAGSGSLNVEAGKGVK
jgi:hypothetical protein